MPVDNDEVMQSTFTFEAGDGNSKAVQIDLKIESGRSCSTCCRRLRYLLLHNMDNPQCLNRTVKVPLFLAMFVLDFVQFGLAFFYISLIYCISSNQQDANDDHYCPIPITFFLFVMMWPPLVPVFDPVVNMAVLCYNTPRIGRLHSITSTLALLSPILSCASFIVVHVDWVDPVTHQIIWTSWASYALVPAVLFFLKVLQIYGTQLYIASAESRTASEWNSLLHVTGKHIKREEFR